MIWDEFLEGLEFFTTKFKQTIPLKNAKTVFRYEWEEKDYTLFVQAMKNMGEDIDRPTLAMVAKIYKQLERGKNELISRECPKCGGTGYMGFYFARKCAEKPGDEEFRLTRCDMCPKGQNMSKAIPSCDEFRDSHGEGTRLDEVGVC